MHWLSDVGKLALSHKKHLIKVLILGAFLSLLYILAAQYVTPFQNNATKSKTAFYTADQAKPDMVRATVTNVYGDTVVARVDDGDQRGNIVELKSVSQGLKVGDRALISVSAGGDLSSYVAASWRVPGLLAIVFLFIAIVYLAIGRRSIASLAGLFISIGVIAFGLIPAILSGANAFWACILVAFIIASLSIIVAHGWRWRSFVSLISVYIVLIFTTILSIIGGVLGHLTGVYDEASGLLQASQATIDLRGVLIGGIVIATLGVLDDIITAQTAAIDELYKANPKLSTKSLIKRGYSIGTEHVISLVNTLALAYAGASLPVVLSITVNLNTYVSPILIFNNEFIAQEVVRTLVSSISLVCAVPISTFVAAVAIKNKDKIITKITTIGRPKLS